MFLHLPLFVLSYLEQFDILNLEIISYILFIILTILFLSYFCKRFKRVRAILNVNFLFIAFNDMDNTWSYDETTITPCFFLFRKHMFICLENNKFSHLQANCSQDREIWEVAYHFWSIQDLDRFMLWLDLNNISSTPYVSFWTILFGGFTILTLLSIGTFYVIPDVFALFIDLDPNINEAMVILEDHNYQVGRSENRWFSIDIEEYNQRVYNQIMLERHEQSMERQRVCEQNVARQIQLVHDADLAHEQYVASRLPTVHEDMLYDNYYFRRMYQAHYTEFRNLNVNGLIINQNIGIYHSYDSLRMNYQRLSLGQYYRVNHSFMLRLVASEVEFTQSAFAPPPVNLHFRQDFHSIYMRYRMEIPKEYLRPDLKAHRPDPFDDFGGWH